MCIALKQQYKVPKVAKKQRGLTFVAFFFSIQTIAGGVVTMALNPFTVYVCNLKTRLFFNSLSVNLKSIV